MSKKANDPDYRPNEWIPVLDADSLDDRTLVEATERLQRQGVEVEAKRRRNGKVTLWRYGGWKN